MARSRIAKAEFRLFKQECRFWIRRLGLKDWRVTIFRVPLLGNTVGECRYDMGNRLATIVVSNRRWTKNHFRREIRRTAKHEVIELLLCRLDGLARRRDVTFSELEEARHQIVRTLEKVVRR